MKERSEIEEKYKWDLTKFCTDEKNFYDRIKKLENQLPKFKEFEGKLSSNEILFKCLEFETEFLVEFSLVAIYAHLKLAENNADRKANEMNETASLIGSKFSNAVSFIDVEISKFNMKKLHELQQDKQFENYKRYFENIIRHKKHTLSKKEELLLSKMGEFMGGSTANFNKFTDVNMKYDKVKDSKGNEHELNQSNYNVFFESKDRELRKNTFTNLNGKYGEFIDFFASNYINSVKEDCVLAKIKNYKSALSASIYCEEASEKVYDLLIKKVRENIFILQDYYNLKKDTMGLEEFAIYDSFAPVCNEINSTFTYEEAIEIIKKSVSVLGEQYVKLIDIAKNDRWIDVFPNKNKHSGAFCTGTVGATPVVLTNFEGNLESVFTLAHELGHAMQTYFSNKNQPVQTADYVIFVAEVASNVNEMLVLKYFLKNSKSKKEKIYYYDHFLRQMRSSIFRQTMFAEFEEYSHAEYEKEMPLSAELLCEKYEELNNFYYGQNVKQIPEMKYEWARIPHFYNSFYVYKYSIGLICAIKISNDLIENPTFYKKYIDFLSSGSSQDPVSLLKIADCDLTNEKTFDSAFEVCKNFIKKWKELI